MRPHVWWCPSLAVVRRNDRSLGPCALIWPLARLARQVVVRVPPIWMALLLTLVAEPE